MAKYLLQASYTTEGLKGVLKDGVPSDGLLLRRRSEDWAGRSKHSISHSVITTPM
jgi:hypothetical protein